MSIGPSQGGLSCSLRVQQPHVLSVIADGAEGVAEASSPELQEILRPVYYNRVAPPSSFH